MFEKFYPIIYENVLTSRLVEEKLQTWCHNTRKRVLFSGIGSELGPSVITAFLNEQDYIIPRYRGFAAIIGKKMALEKIFGEFMRKRCGAARGLGDSGSFQDLAFGICGYSVVMGANFGTAVGLGLAIKLKLRDCIIVCFFGDGEASRSTFGSALNMASLFKLPILFVCQNNGISISTPLEFMSSTKTIAGRASGYNIPAITLKDKEPLKLITHTKEAVDYVRGQKSPFLLEILEERFTPHISIQSEESFLGGDIPDNKNSVAILKNFLIEEGINEKFLRNIEEKAREKVENSFSAAYLGADINSCDFFKIYNE